LSRNKIGPAPHLLRPLIRQAAAMIMSRFMGQLFFRFGLSPPFVSASSD
jgi:hypothetical protein